MSDKEDSLFEEVPEEEFTEDVQDEGSLASDKINCPYCGTPFNGPIYPGLFPEDYQNALALCLTGSVICLECLSMFYITPQANGTFIVKK
jgi:hypothetical protein